MMESLLKIDLLEVKNPSQFTAKVVLPEEKDVYEKAWQEWQREMQVLEKKRIINDNIHIDEVCAVKDDQDKNWHRVRVEKIFYSMRGERVSCYFVDSGQRKDFLRARLFNLPERYQCARVHPQVRSLKLGGLQPMSLQIEATDNGLRVPNRPTNKWDDSAVNHFDSLTKECDGAGVRVMGQDEEGNLQVCLYLRKNAQLINVNELLIEEEYACSTSAGASSDSDSSGCSRQVRGTAPQRPASDQMRKDGMVNDEEDMSEEQLKEVMAKVQRVIAKSKNHSDTETTPRGHGGPKLGSRPPLGSQAASRNGGLVSPGGEGDVPEGSVTSPMPGLEGASITLSPAGDGPLLLSDTGLRAVASPPRLSKPSPSGSINSGATQSHNGHENTSTQYSAVPKFRCADSSPELVAELMGVTSPCTLRQPVTAPTRQESVLGSGLKPSPVLSFPGQGHSQGQVPHQGQGSSPLTPASLAKSTSAAGVSLPSPGATPSGAGRGRGLRKLYSDDITKAGKATPSVNPSAQPGNAVSRPTATDMGAKPKLKCPSNDLENSNPFQDSISPAAASLKGGAENIKCPSNDLRNSKLSKGGTSPGATAAALNVVAAGNPLPKDKVARLKEFHAKRQKGQRGSSSDGTVSDTGLVNGLTGAQGPGPSYLDGNSSDSDMFRVQERKRVSFSDMQSLRQNKVLKEDAALIADASAGERSSDSGSDGAKALSEGESLAYYSRKKFRGKAAGQSLLDLLGSQADSSSGDYTTVNTVKVPQVWRSDNPIPNPFLGTIVCGSHAPAPLYDLNDVPFNDIVKSYMLKEQFKATRSIQANVWPAILRGRHVIGILPPKSGKTTSYLLPLVTKLLATKDYLKLPSGCGPKAVILVPSCKKADYIFDYIRTMLRERRTLLRVQRIYGCEEHHVMPLLKGCDLLIATPSCLLRMLDRRYTFLDRLCHLVLDGVEVLVEQFTAQVRQVMKVYGEKLSQYRSLPVQRQIMTFGYNWTEGVAAFQKAYQRDPVLVFASRLEAAVYGGVQQVVHMCFDKQHLSTLKDLLDSLLAVKEHRHIIIALTNPGYLESIAELLKSMSVYAQVVESDAHNDEVLDLADKWRDQSGCSPVLVVTDNNVTALRVSTAEVVIHFDMPDSKTKFGNRLALMKDHFHDRCADPEEKEKEGRVDPVSHLLVTNRMLDHVQSLHGLLVRSGAVIPPAMTKLLDGMRLGKNEDLERRLCLHVKQFGKCANEDKCESRHLMLPCDFVEDREQSWPPATGTVKVRILQVKSTSRFYVMLLEHQAAGEAKRDLQCLYTSLTMDLAMHMSNPKNQAPFCMEQGLRFLAAVKDDDGLFHRARVVTTLHSSLTSGTTTVKVFCVDEGREMEVRLEQLLKLPQKLQDIPPLAVEVFACRVRPVDGDSNWTNSSKDFAAKQLMGKDLYGTIVLRLQNTVWLDPLAQQTRLKSLKTNIVSMIYRSELLRRGMAEDNPDHVKHLYTLCEGKVDIPKKLYEKYLHLPPRQKIETETLAKDEGFHEVCISVVDNPHHFYVQKRDNQKDLALLVEELNQHMDKVLKARADAGAAHPTHSHTDSTTAAGHSPLKAGEAILDAGEAILSAQGSAREATVGSRTATPESSPRKCDAQKTEAGVGTNVSQMNGSEGQKPEVNFEQGSVCAVKFKDGSWYRGQMVERMEGGWKVFFVDYGEREVVGESSIHHLLDKFCLLPAQAIECSLAHVNPAGEEWSAESGDIMWDLAHYVNDDKKTLLAKEVGTQESMFAGATRHVLELYDTSLSSRDVLFSHTLVWLQEAKAEDEGIKDLFPRVTFNSRKLYKDLEEKICDQCAALYWAEGERAKQLAKMVADGIVADLIIGSTKKDHPALQSIVKLIGYLRSCDAQSTLLAAIVKCAETSPEVCAAVIGKDLMLKLVTCLEQVRKASVQVQAASTAAQLAKIDGFTPCLDCPEIISVMGDILKADDPTPEMLRHVCSFLSSVLMQGHVCAEEVKKMGVSQTVLELIAETSDPDTQECLLALLAAMASWESLHADLLRERAIQQILGTMREAPSQHCVFHCARICQSLCRANRRNKRILLEGELVLIIRDLVAGGLQSPARELCEELNTSLAIAVPQQQVMSGVHVDVRSAAHTAGSLQAPLVKWSQNSFRVLLTVSVRGAREKDFTITQNQVHFMHEMSGVRYGFDYTLFGGLEPEKCRVNVHQQEVILSLAKEEKGMWSRLLKEKNKFTNLTPDYEHLVDSSDSEVDDPDNITQLTREKVVRLPKLEEKEWEAETYEFSCTDDSDSNSDLGLGTYTDDERFEDPSDFIDPNFVLEKLIYDNAAQQERTANNVEPSRSGNEM